MRVRVRVNWYEFRTGLIIMAMYGSVFAAMAFIGGIVAGLPFPPRWDDFAFAMFVIGVVVPGVYLGWLMLRDFIAALRKATSISAADGSGQQEPPSARLATTRRQIRSR